MRAMHVAAVTFMSAVSIGSWSTVVIAQASGHAATRKGEEPTAADPGAFLTRAADAGLVEIELGRLAAQRGSSDTVKAYGTLMVVDHTDANAEMRALAAKKGYALPASLDGKHVALRDELRMMSGAQFDQAYMAAMTRDHDAVVDDFTTAARSSADDGVKRFAARMLPILEGHLAKAREIQASLAHGNVP